MNSKNGVKILLAAHFSIWMILALILDVHPDMADHWVWSRHLSWGYYEHPPMVALTMRIVTFLIPAHPIYALKIGSVLFSTLILWLAYKVAESFYSEKEGFILLLILESTPYFSMASIFWHIDQPYLVAWLGGLWAFSKYIETKNLNWVLLFGVIAGFGATSKYIMLLFYFGLLVWVVVDKRFRFLLVKWQTYAAGVISFGIFSPVFIWNATHEWRSFRFQFERGLNKYNPFEIFGFTAGHMVLFSAVFSILLVKLLISKKLFTFPVSEKTSFLLALGGFPFFFFTATSLRGFADQHWVNVGYISMFVLLAHFMKKMLEQKKGGTYTKMFAGSFLINYFLLTLVLLQAFYSVFDTPIKNDASKKFVSWAETGRQIEELMKENDFPEPEFVITREYQLGGALSLYMKSQPLPHAIEKIGRNLWSPNTEVAKAPHALVCIPDECQRTVRRASERLNLEYRNLGTVTTQVNGNLVRKLSVFVPVN